MIENIKVGDQVIVAQRPTKYITCPIIAKDVLGLLDVSGTTPYKVTHITIIEGVIHLRIEEVTTRASDGVLCSWWVPFNVVRSMDYIQSFQSTQEAAEWWSKKTGVR